jgi:hypothetical protein
MDNVLHLVEKIVCYASGVDKNKNSLHCIALYSTDPILTPTTIKCHTYHLKITKTPAKHIHTHTKYWGERGRKDHLLEAKSSKASAIH